MSTLNDLEMAYLRGLGKTGSINSMRAAQYGAISDKAIQDTYVALSTLTPVEDFSVNDHMRCGLGGFTADELDVMLNPNIFILDGSFEDFDASAVNPYGGDADFSIEVEDGISYLHIVSREDAGVFMELPWETTGPPDFDSVASTLTPIVGGDDLYTVSIDMRGDPADYADFNLWRYNEALNDSDDTANPVGAGATNVDDGGNNIGIYYALFAGRFHLTTAWTTYHMHFRVPETTDRLGFEVYSFGDHMNFDVRKMGIWLGTSHTWRP